MTRDLVCADLNTNRQRVTVSQTVSFTLKSLRVLKLVLLTTYLVSIIILTALVRIIGVLNNANYYLL